jgi:DNA-directed RNA polymerase specialized sigma24 family protein
MGMTVGPGNPIMKQKAQTDMGGEGGVFLTTHWSLIDSICAGHDKGRGLVDSLLRNYWKPVYCYLRRRGYANEEAKDLTQAFFHEIVLGKELIQQADRTKGRFRSFLLTALRNYLVNVQDKEHARKRVPRGRLISLDMVDEEVLPSVAADLSPDECFNHVWISSLLEQALQDVETSCHEDGKTVYWKVFEERVLQPIVEETRPPEIRDLCERYGIPDGGKLANMIVTVKRRIRTVLEKRIRDSVGSPDEASRELQEMARFFPKLAQNLE